jgi:hypothetical protein
MSGQSPFGANLLSRVTDRFIHIRKDGNHDQSGGASIVGSLPGYPMLAMMSTVAAMLC